MKKVHYAWVICFACALMLFCTSGLCGNTFTIYQPYIRAQNGFTNAQSSAIVTARTISSFASMLLTGIYYKRVSLRIGMVLGVSACVAGFVLYAFASHHFVYCLAAGLCGLGQGFAGMIPAAMILGRWFHKDRTLAVALCGSATGLSVIGVPQALTRLIESRGLRFSFLIHASVLAVIVLVIGLLLRNKPEDKGQLPYGEGTQISISVKRHGRYLKKSTWFLLVPLLLLFGAVNSVAYNHLTMLTTAQGFPPQTIATAISVTGIALISGKSLYGVASSKLGTFTCNWIYGFLLICGLVGCAGAAGKPILLFVSIGAYALGLAIPTVGIAAWAGELASPEQYDKTVQAFQSLSTGGALLLSTFPGILADRYDGSYVPAYACFAVFALFSVLSIQWIYARAKRSDA